LTDFKNLRIFAQLQSEIIDEYIWNKIYHFTLIALLHCRVKWEQMQFCETRIVAFIFL